MCSTFIDTSPEPTLILCIVGTEDPKILRIFSVHMT
jgi:hypothetical protein